MTEAEIDDVLLNAGNPNTIVQTASNYTANASNYTSATTTHKKRGRPFLTDEVKSQRAAETNEAAKVKAAEKLSKQVSKKAKN